MKHHVWIFLGTILLLGGLADCSSDNINYSGDSDGQSSDSGTDGDTNVKTDGDAAEDDNEAATDGDLDSEADATSGDSEATDTQEPTTDGDSDSVTPPADGDHDSDTSQSPDGDVDSERPEGDSDMASEEKALGHRCSYSDSVVTINSGSGVCAADATCVGYYDMSTTCTAAGDCQSIYGHAAACIIRSDGTSFCAASWCSQICGDDSGCDAMSDYGTACCNYLAGSPSNGLYCLPGDFASVCTSNVDGDEDSDVADGDFDSQEREQDSDGELTTDTCDTQGALRCDGTLAEHCSHTGYWKIDRDCALLNTTCSNGACVSGKRRH